LQCYLPEAAGDQHVGRCAAGLPNDSANFAVLPPFFLGIVFKFWYCILLLNNNNWIIIMCVACVSIKVCIVRAPICVGALTISIILLYEQHEMIPCGMQSNLFSHILKIR